MVVITPATTMAAAPATTSPARRLAAKSRRRLFHCAAGVPLRAVPRRRNEPPSEGDNVWATRASTLDIGHQPFELRTMGVSLRLFRPPGSCRLHSSRYGGRLRSQAPKGSSPIVKVSLLQAASMTLRCSSESEHVRTQGCGALNAAAGFDHKISIRNSMLLCVTIGGNWRIHLSSSLSAASRPKCGTAWSRRTRGTAR